MVERLTRRFKTPEYGKRPFKWVTNVIEDYATVHKLKIHTHVSYNIADVIQWALLNRDKKGDSIVQVYMLPETVEHNQGMESYICSVGVYRPGSETERSSFTSGGIFYVAKKGFGRKKRLANHLNTLLDRAIKTPVKNSVK